MARLYSYKMSQDDLFAPNPHFGVLTLATCKPKMRLKVPVGAWVAGCTSLSMKACRTPVGREKLVYLAKVTSKLTYGEYWEQFLSKRPGDTQFCESGDNIYCPDESQFFGLRLVSNLHHKTEVQKIKDMSGKFVLVCEEFYYFVGREDCKPLEIPIGVRPNVPKGQSACGIITYDPTAFINYVRQNAGQCQFSNY